MQPSQKKSVILFGSTGSVGQQTVDLLLKNPHLFDVTALVANRDTKRIVQQALLLKPQRVVLRDPSTYQDLKNTLAGLPIEVAAGEQAFLETADYKADWVLSAIVGIAGLESSYRSLKENRVVALANKESLVAAGQIFMNRVKEAQAHLIPVDSEHSAIYQLFPHHNPSSVDRMLLTASGGPFWRKPLDELKDISPEEAIRHPNWNMGKKISLDSATLMNKALEVIEAHYLFNNFPIDQIDVLIHPESIVHGAILLKDGSILSQLNTPDMHIPIAHALGWPHRIHTEYKNSFNAFQNLTFYPLDEQSRFRALFLARQAIREKKEIILNAANEVAVQAFFDKKIPFHQIIVCIESMLNQISYASPQTLNEILETHEDCERKTSEHIHKIMNHEFTQCRQ